MICNDDVFITDIGSPYPWILICIEINVSLSHKYYNTYGYGFGGRICVDLKFVNAILITFCCIFRRMKIKGSVIKLWHVWKPSISQRMMRACRYNKTQCRLVVVLVILITCYSIITLIVVFSTVIVNDCDLWYWLGVITLTVYSRILIDLVVVITTTTITIVIININIIIITSS